MSFLIMQNLSMTPLKWEYETVPRVPIKLPLLRGKMVLLGLGLFIAPPPPPPRIFLPMPLPTQCQEYNIRFNYAICS